MTARNTVRLLVTLSAALCVVTMFAGSAAAVDLGAVSVGDGGDDAAVDIDTGLGTEAGQGGGGGSGSVSVDTAKGGVEGVGAVEGDVQNKSLTVAASGEGGPAGNEAGGGIECEIGSSSETCEFDTPGGGDDNPGDGSPLPEAPGGDLPIDLDGGNGSFDINTGQGGAEGVGAVESDVQNKSLTVAASGEGGPAGNVVGGGVECELSPDSAQSPQDACEFDTPGGGDNPLPVDPGGDNPLPVDPGGDNPLPVDPGGDNPLPVDPGGDNPLPVDGLQSL